jgi:hypothetical protein
MVEALVVACWILWSVLCYNLATQKHRNGALAIIAGLVFGIFAVLYYATVGDAEAR